MPIIKLQSSDGDIFEVDVEVAKTSTTIKTMLDNLGHTDEEEVIPIPKVNSMVLQKVIDWAIQHKDDPSPPEPRRRSPQQALMISNWDREFFDVDQAFLFELIQAANYLEIKGLLDTACKTVANMIRGKSPEEIRSVMGIVNNFSPEEEEQIRLENKYNE